MMATPYIHNGDWAIEVLPRSIEYDQYSFKHSLLYRNRAGFTPKLREYMENIATAVYSNTFSDRTIRLVQTNNGIMKLAITI